MKRLARRAWESTTITTWTTQLTRTSSIFIVLPLVLRSFESSELAVWYLFMGFISLAGLADFGFRSTFIRLIAFGAGGATHVGIQSGGSSSRERIEGENWELIERLVAVMRRIYAFTSIAVALVLGTIGSLALLRPLSALPQEREAWIAWALISLTATVEFQGQIYRNYLEGLNFVALARRVETLSKVGAILTSLAVMVFAPSLLNLVIANRGWALVNVMRDRYLAHTLASARWSTFRKLPFDNKLFRDVWRPAWRSGIAGLMSNGLTSLTGVFYAQFGTASSLASYLLGLKIVSELRNLSYAPLYSKVPLLGRLRAKGEESQVYKIARRGMNISYAFFVSGVLIAGFTAPFLLKAVGSQTDFVAPGLWWLLSAAFLAHRIGSMHLQYYQTTNHVVSHIVDGLSGVIFAGATAVLLRPLGVYAFPIAMLLGYAGVHTWLSVRYSFTAMRVPARQFARDFLFPPALGAFAIGCAWFLTRP